MIKKGDLYYPAKDFREKAWISDDKIYEKAGKDPVGFWEKLAEELFGLNPGTKRFCTNLLISNGLWEGK